MTNATEILPGTIFYSFLTATLKEKVGFFGHNALVLQVAGNLKPETASETITTNPGDMMLIGKNQLGTLTKTPSPGDSYQSIVIVLQEETLRSIALEEQIQLEKRYT